MEDVGVAPVMLFEVGAMVGLEVPGIGVPSPRERVAAQVKPWYGGIHTVTDSPSVMEKLNVPSAPDTVVMVCPFALRREIGTPGRGQLNGPVFANTVEPYTTEPVSSVMWS